MDTRTQKINRNLIEYVNLVKKHHNIGGAYLFGSRANGNSHKYSDYDIAIISEDAKNRHEFLVSLIKLARNIDLPIEPHPMTQGEFTDPSYLLGQEVRKYGVNLL